MAYTHRFIILAEAINSSLSVPQQVSEIEKEDRQAARAVRKLLFEWEGWATDRAASAPLERFGSAADGGSSTRPAAITVRYARGACDPLLCRTHALCMSPRQPTHALCMSPISWLAAWSLAEGLATAERYAVAMAVATDMAAARLLPSPRQPSRSKQRGRGGMSGSSLAQPRVRKLWQCERARRPARGVLRASTARPQQRTPAPCPRPACACPAGCCPRAKPHALVRARLPPALGRSCLPLPSPAHASPCPRKLTPATLASPAHASRQLPSVGRSSRQIPVLASGHRRRRGGPSGGMGPAAMRRLSPECESFPIRCFTLKFVP